MIRKKMLRQPTSPGQILKEEFLDPLGISQTAFAQHTGWTQPKVSDIVNGRLGISSETAMVLADAFNTTPQFWLNLQNEVDLWKASRTHKKVRALVKIQ